MGKTEKNLVGRTKSDKIEIIGLMALFQGSVSILLAFYYTFVIYFSWRVGIGPTLIPRQ